MSKTVRTGLALTAVASLLLMAGVAFGGPGDLDRGFGADGRRIITGVSAAEALAIQPDGRIVVAGWNGNVAVARLNPDGSNDPAFGGTRFVDFGSFDLGQAVALQPDGKIVVVGRTSDNVTIARLNANGSLDMGFGSGGKRTIDYGGRDGAEGVVVQPDGKILVAGFGGADRNLLVTRLHGNGTNDTDFGSGGTARIDFGLGPEEGRALALQADGKIVVAGFTIGSTGDFDDVAIARLNPRGAPDMGFGVQGRRKLSPAGPVARAEALAVQPDGKIVMAGTASDQFWVMRLNPNGSDDDSFGGGGVRRVRFGSSFEGGGAVASQPDGKVVAVGWAANDLAIARLQPGGLLDTTFGGLDQDGNRTGKRTISLGAGNAVALQADGRIVVAGSVGVTGPAFVARLEGDPRASGEPGPRGGPGPSGGTGARGQAPRCAGMAATIVGTARRDVLRGTPQRDVIVGLAGGDLVHSGAGNDLVCGGAGRDRLHGQKRADRLLGGPGPDRLEGGSGPDRLLGQKGPDRLLGQGGGDRLFGGPGADTLRGGPARDACLGGPGRDRAACEGKRGL